MRPNFHRRYVHHLDRLQRKPMFCLDFVTKRRGAGNLVGGLSGWAIRSLESNDIFQPQLYTLIKVLNP